MPATGARTSRPTCYRSAGPVVARAWGTSWSASTPPSATRAASAGRSSASWTCSPSMAACMSWATITRPTTGRWTAWSGACAGSCCDPDHRSGPPRDHLHRGLGDAGRGRGGLLPPEAAPLEPRLRAEPARGAGEPLSPGPAYAPHARPHGHLHRPRGDDRAADLAAARRDGAVGDARRVLVHDRLPPRVPPEHALHLRAPEPGALAPRAASGVPSVRPGARAARRRPAQAGRGRVRPRGAGRDEAPAAAGGAAPARPRPGRGPPGGGGGALRGDAGA